MSDAQLTTGLSHIAVAVPDLEAAIATFARVFRVTASSIMENPAQGVRLAYAELAHTRIELLQPTAPGSPLARFLERHPAGGIHHVSLIVANLDAALAAAASAGARQAGIAGANVHGERIAFLDPRDLLGALFELEERP